MMTKMVESLNLNDLKEFSETKQVRKKLLQSDALISEVVYFEPGQVGKLHIHPHQDEIFYCVEGRGKITFAERDDIPIVQGSVIYVPARVRHGAEALDDDRLVLLFMKGPGSSKAAPA